MFVFSAYAAAEAPKIITVPHTATHTATHTASHTTTHAATQAATHTATTPEIIRHPFANEFANEPYQNRALWLFLDILSSLHIRGWLLWCSNNEKAH